MDIGPHILDFIIECSNTRQDLMQTSTIMRMLDFTSKKLTARFIGHKFVFGPPMSILCPCHVISVPRPSPLFAALSLPCIILNTKDKERHLLFYGMGWNRTKWFRQIISQNRVGS